MLDAFTCYTQSKGLRCLFVDLHLKGKVFSRTGDSDETDVTVFIGS